ncbi:MAG: transcriptional repressor [Deltaproteobacteria bacterium]|nr:transcriptional repressor [Deltaproteobacteria bacterium]
MNVKDAVSAFNDYLQSQGLKLTRQRALITEVFFDPAKRADHPTVEELYLRVKGRDSTVGHATVYRTLKLLVDGKLATPNRIGEDLTRYEPEVPGEHHDHMVCAECGLIIEFEDAEIERLQEQVAARHGFALRDHSMNLVVAPRGDCARADCLKGAAGEARGAGAAR